LFFAPYDLRLTLYGKKERTLEQLKGEGLEISIFKKEVKELEKVPKIDFHDS
jgi:hypothetical protein